MKRIIAKILIFVLAASAIVIPFDVSEAYTGYVKVGKYYYCYNAKGKMKKYYESINGKPYYFLKNGRAASKGWLKLKDGSKRYCLGKGRLASGYKKIGKYYYYFDKKGKMKTGLQIINGKPYYFEKNGRAAARKWIKQTAGNKLYSLGKGKLAVGNIKIGNGIYYFDSRGTYIPRYFVTEVPELSTDEISYAGKKYKMFCQYSKKYKGYNEYLASHGCTVTTLTAVLRAYVLECSQWTPYETVTIAEKSVVGNEAFKKNYSKKLPKQMPITFNTITKILNKYGIAHQYVDSFNSDKKVKEDIVAHLRTGKPVIYVISQHNRATGKKTDKWTGSYHTMLMIGIDGNNNVLIGNPAGSQRFQIVSLDEMINYMWSCTKTPNGKYWNGKPRCGGYIKIME